MSFEQFNDQPRITLNTFDANVYNIDNASATASVFDAYLYSIHPTGDQCIVEMHAELHMPTVTTRDRYYRLRKGVLNDAIDGTTDGIWCDVFYASPQYIEDVTLKVWATENRLLTIA